MKKQLNNYLVRPVTGKDSKRVWEIRNHPLNQKNFNHPEKINFERHAAWFNKKYFNKEDNYCFVLVTEGKVIGYCRFDQEEDNDYLISIALDPGYHHKGFGHLLLSQSLRMFSSSRLILAEVRKDNIASLKLFQKNNFQIYKEDAKSYYFKYERQ